MVSSRSGLPRMWFSARAVKVNGKSRPARRLDRGGDPLGCLADLVDPPAGIKVLDRAAGRAGGGRQLDRPGRVLGVGAVAVLEVDRDRQPTGLVDDSHVGDHLVQRRLAVEPSEGKGEGAAARRQRLEAQTLQYSGRAGVPRIGDQERLALVQRSEAGALLALPLVHPSTIMPR